MGYNTININAAGGVKTYADLASFPVGKKLGDVAIALDTNFLYYWDGALWVQMETAQVATGQYKPEPLYTVTATDVTNKYVILADVPTDKELTTFTIFGGLAQAYGTDFIVSPLDGGKRVTWDGLGLDGIIETGDQISIIYN